MHAPPSILSPSKPTVAISWTTPDPARLHSGRLHLERTNRIQKVDSDLTDFPDRFENRFESSHPSAAMIPLRPMLAPSEFHLAFSPLSRCKPSFK
ncbi:hypothetical protein ACOSQ2_003167 [Xanthoceras sorbifolium]